MSRVSPRTLWLLLWVVLAGALVYRAGRRPDSRGVILDHLEFSRRLAHGEDVNGPWKSDPDAPLRPLHAPYPPSFGLLTAPFSVVAETCGVRAARIAWASMQVVCLLTVALVLRRRTTGPPPSTATNYWHVLWLCTFVVGARFVLRDTHGGGGNIVNLALCLLAFDDAERGRERRAGLWLGLSLVTKPTQLWLLPVFLCFGRPRVVAAAVGTAIAGVAVTIALQRFDVAPWLRWIEGSWRIATQADAFATPALDFPAFEWMNQSLRCGLARWLGTVPAEFAARVTLGVPAGLGLDVSTVAMFGRGLALALTGAVLAVAWRVRSSAPARPWVFAAALVLSLLLSPLTWKAHHTALLPVLFLLLRQLHAHRSRALLGVLIAWAICCLPGKEIVGDAVDEWCNSLYVVTAWDIVLLAIALAMAWSAAREHGDAAPPTQFVELRR